MPDSYYGREVIRATGYGNVGIGPVFGFTTNDLPQSHLHINPELNTTAWFQMTVDNTTGQLATDGLRIGVDGTNSDVIFNQQENANVRILSGDNSGGVNE